MIFSVAFMALRTCRNRKEVTNNKSAGYACSWVIWPGKIYSQPLCLGIVISSEKPMLLERDDSADLAPLIALWAGSSFCSCTSKTCNFLFEHRGHVVLWIVGQEPGYTGGWCCPFCRLGQTRKWLETATGGPVMTLREDPLNKKLMGIFQQCCLMLSAGGGRWATKGIWFRLSLIFNLL